MMKKRAFSLFLVLAVCLSMFPAGALATEEDEIWDDVVIETPEPQDATPTEAPAEPEQTPEITPEAAPEATPETAPEATPEPTEEPETSAPAEKPDRVAEVQAMIDALPTAEEVAAMDMDGQREAYIQTQAAYDAYMALPEELRALIAGAEKLEALFGFFNRQIMPLDSVTATYRDLSGNDVSVDATVVTSDTTTWSTGWYVVDGSVAISSRITVSGTVNLILADGFTLGAQKGIKVSSGNSLTIWGQAGDSGTLNADTDFGTGGDAGIGGDQYQSNGTIVINGGTIKASAHSTYGAGIGGGNGRIGSNITINGGTVTATGSSFGAGIGGGSNGAGSNITIKGGTVTATGGGNDAKGIGGGYRASTSNVTITGGTVIASGSVAIGAAPNFGKYIHITTDQADTTLYECTGQVSDDWSWEAVKIQPVAIEMNGVEIESISEPAVKGRKTALSVAKNIAVVGLPEKFSEYEETILVGAQSYFDINWSVEGTTANSKVTDGELYVDPAETAKTLTVKAELNGESASTEVSVIAPFAISGQPESKTEKVYGYDTFQISTEITGKNMADAAFQWYDTEAINGADQSSYSVPTGLDVGRYTYYCVISDTEGEYTETSGSAVLIVDKKELTPGIAGESVPITKIYDGTTAVLADLSIELDGVVRGDEGLVTAAAESYAYDGLNVTTTGTITASNITLSGSKAGNYVLTETSATIAGTITPKLLDIGDQSFEYSGKNTFELELDGVNGEKVTVTLTADSADAGEYEYTASGSGDSIAAPANGYYTVTIKDSNYAVGTAGTLTILPAKIYTVSFDSQGGSAVASVEVRHGQKVAKPADPTRSGYAFGGWYTDAACTAAYNFSSGVTEDLILYAKWTEATDDASQVESNMPQTGDNTKLVLWAVLLGLSFIGIAVVLVQTVRSKRNGRKSRG